MYIYALCCLFVINPTVFLDTIKYVKTKPVYNLLFIISALCAFWRRLRYQSFANFPCQWMIHEVISKEAGYENSQTSYRWFNNAIRR